MKQHFISLGWGFIGNCGCSENKEMYSNPNYPNWFLWITKGGDRVDFRKSYGNDRDTKLKGRAGARNYSEAYEYWVINDRD